MFKELWFLENPIETKIGNLRFIKVREYGKLLFLSSVLQVDKDSIGEYIKKTNLFKDNIDLVLQEINQLPLFTIIKEVKWLGLYDNYTDLFNFCFENEGSFDLIETDEEFEFYCNLIKEINHLEFEKPNPNPELAYYDKLERIAKERRGEVITFKSLVLNVGLYRNDVLDMSIYSLHEYFNTISTNKNFDTTVLYQTVSTEKLQLTPWYADTTAKKTKLDESDKQFIGKHLGMIKDNPSKNKNAIIDNLK